MHEKSQFCWLKSCMFVSLTSSVSRLWCRPGGWRFWRWSRSQSPNPESYPLRQDRNERLVEINELFYISKYVNSSFSFSPNQTKVYTFYCINKQWEPCGLINNIFFIFVYSAFNYSKFSLHRLVAAVWLTLTLRSRQTHTTTHICTDPHWPVCVCVWFKDLWIDVVKYSRQQLFKLLTWVSWTQMEPFVDSSF